MSAVLACVLLTGCGGSSGTPAVVNPPVVTTLGTITAQLAGADPDTNGAIVIRIRSDGDLIFAVTVPQNLVGLVSAILVQRARLAGEVPLVGDLLPSAGPFSADGTATGTFGASVADAQAMAAEPDEYSIVVETNGADPLQGGVSGAATHEWHARLLGSNEPDVIDADAAGAGTFLVHTSGTIDYVLAMSTDPVTDINDAHLHAAPAGTPGPIVVDLEVDTAVFDAGAGTITGSVPVTAARLSQILANLKGHYCNVHTAAALDGLARGQLRKGFVGMWARLNGDEEVQDPIPEPDAAGGATISFDTFTSGVAILAVPVGQGNGLDDLDNAHIHVGAAGQNGGIVIPLMDGADLNRNVDTGSVEGSIAYDQTLFTRILAGPGNFYVNFHSLDAPAGFTRGQLGMTPETFVADLLSENEFPALPAGDSGRMRVVFTGIHTCNFTLTMDSPPVGDVIGAHIHDGPAGVNGPILVDFLGTGEQTVNGLIQGNATFTGRSFARFLASDIDFYCNIHTEAQQDGAVRGQLVRITDETPPSELSYSESPACYLNNTPITANTPSNEGGAISSYSIDPQLPAGLDFDTSTGVISGTPTATSPNATYTITGRNAAGETTVDLDLKVDVEPPKGLSYTTPVTYEIGDPITPNTPASTGGPIVSYAINPDISATGLAFNTGTGVISGTPDTVNNGPVNYQVTATNASGQTQATVRIDVVDTLDPPSNLDYTTTNATYETGYVIENNEPSFEGGAPTSYSISPAIKGGLSFSTTTGIISGTPTSTDTAGTTYTITATNDAGNDTVEVTITINVGRPGPFTYTNEPLIAYQNQQIQTMQPMHIGGAAATQYTISPSLPNGLMINQNTGDITGTPTAFDEMGTQYTVTASNAGGNRTAQVMITIYQQQ